MRYALFLAIGLSLFGCAPTIRGASRAVVDESVEQLTSDETQHDLAQATQDPKVQFATREMTDQITAGLLNSLANQDEQVKGLARTFVAAAVDQLMIELSAPKNRGRMGALTAAFTETAIKQLALGMQEDLGPAMVTVLQKDLTPELARALGQSLQPAIANTAETFAHHAVLGANAGLDQAWGAEPLADVEGMSDRLTTWTWLAIVGLGLVTLIVIALAVMVVARAARARAEVQRLENATLLLASALRAQNSPESGELVKVVEEALRRPAGTGRLRGAHT